MYIIKKGLVGYKGKVLRKNQVHQSEPSACGVGHNIKLERATGL